MKEVWSYSCFADGKTWGIEQLSSFLKVKWHQKNSLYTQVSYLPSLWHRDLFCSLFQPRCPYWHNAVTESRYFPQFLWRLNEIIWVMCIPNCSYTIVVHYYLFYENTLKLNFRKICSFKSLCLLAELPLMLWRWIRKIFEVFVIYFFSCFMFLTLRSEVKVESSGQVSTCLSSQLQVKNSPAEGSEVTMPSICTEWFPCAWIYGKCFQVLFPWIFMTMYIIGGIIIPMYGRTVNVNGSYVICPKVVEWWRQDSNPATLTQDAGILTTTGSMFLGITK